VVVVVVVVIRPIFAPTSIEVMSGRRRGGVVMIG